MRQKTRVQPEVGEHYYCKARRDVVVCTRPRFGGGFVFQRLLGPKKEEYIDARDFHTLQHLNEMQVIACVARIVDRRESGRDPG